MNITLDLYHPEEMRAFAVFLNACAEEHDRQVKDKEAYGLGGIDRAYNPAWGNVVGSGEKTVDTADAAKIDESYLTDRAGAAPHPEGVASLVATRKRGEPSPGHKRRTKAEIAEDEAAVKLIDETDGKIHLTVNASPEVAAVLNKSAISTGGERVAPDDEPEVEQQDVADEADETAKAGAELSHDDVRNAMGQYVTKFGMDAAQIDIPKVFQLALKDDKVTKVSLIPGDQASLKKAVDGVMEMLTKNPFSRDAVA